MAKSAYPRLHRAIKFAAKAHKKQDREGEYPLPYVTHPLEVLHLVRYEGEVIDEEVLCAAVLHDIVEETNKDLDDLEDEFGPGVADLVRQLTREDPDPEVLELPEEEIWKVRQSMMLAEIDKMTINAKLVKLADRLSNLRDAFRTKSDEKLDRYVRQSHEILQHIDRAVCPDLWDRIYTLIQKHQPASTVKQAKAKKDPLKTPTIAG